MNAPLQITAAPRPCEQDDFIPRNEVFLYRVVFLPIFRRRHSGLLFKNIAEVTMGRKAKEIGDGGNGRIGEAQHLFRRVDPLLQNIIPKRLMFRLRE